MSMTPARSLLSRFQSAWDTFWFGRMDARVYAAMRITFGAMLLANYLSLAPQFNEFMGPDGYYPLSMAMHTGVPERWSLFDEPRNATELWQLYWLCSLPMVGMIVGVQSRLMTVLALLVQVSFLHRNMWIQNGGDNVLRLSNLYLALAPTGLAWSFDAWWARKRREAKGEDAPRSPLASVLVCRLIQIQLVVIYIATGYAKFPGETWHQGTALFYALTAQNFQRFPELTDKLLEFPLVHMFTALGSWITLWWELAFGLMMVWRPSRILGIAIGVALHLSIFATMEVGYFSPAMLWCYQAFFTVPLLVWRPEIRSAIRATL